MSENQIRIADVGTRILLTVKDDNVIVDLSSSTLITLVFVKPSDASVSKTATFYTDGTDGMIYYDSEAGFFDEAGIWKFQAVITFPSGSWRSDINTFRVYPNLS